MNNKILKQHKIDEKYILSKRKFLYTFGYLCLDNEIIKNEKIKNKRDLNDLYYFLEKQLKEASEEQVNYTNITTGKIILVGTGNKFKAYYRPVFRSILLKQKNNSSKINRIEHHKNNISSLKTMNLSELLNEYYNNEDDKISLLYLEEILFRTSIKNVKKYEDSPRKDKIKCHKKNISQYIDKNHKRDKI